MSETKILTGPDGRYYEIPVADLERFAVPGARVNEVRQRLAADAGPAMPSGHFRPGDPLPPGVPPPPGAAQAVTVAAGPSASTTIATPNGGTVVLNFYFAPPSSAVDASGSVEGYHMTFGATGIPTNHFELMWGDYIDKQGHPQVGWHSHDPVTGNAQ